jgi:hypothetical protein
MDQRGGVVPGKLGRPPPPAELLKVEIPCVLHLNPVVLPPVENLARGGTRCWPANTILAKQLRISPAIPLKDQQVLHLAVGQPGTASRKGCPFHQHVSACREFNRPGLPTGNRGCLANGQHVAGHGDNLFRKPRRSMEIEALFPVRHRSPDSFHPLLKFQLPPVHVAGEAPLEVDPKEGNPVGIGCGQRSSFRRRCWRTSR